MTKFDEHANRQILVPFDRAEGITLAEAAGIAGKSVSTVRGWCDQHGVGRRVGGGVWVVSRPALLMFLDGDLEALAGYHAGDRSSGLVVPYFARAAIADDTADQQQIGSF